jgi:hypothetical protein
MIDHKSPFGAGNGFFNRWTLSINLPIGSEKSTRAALLAQVEQGHPLGKAGGK